MKDPLNLLKTLKRPSLLVAAAQHASAGYQRDRVLRRLLKCTAASGHGEAAMRLVMLESDMEEARRNREAGYSPTRHVTVLAALIGEARGLRARAGQVKASASSVLRAVT